MVPGYPLYIEDISYWIPDIEELQYAMATGLGVNVDSRLKSRVKKIANEYSESIPESLRTPTRSRYEYDSNFKTYDDDKTSSYSTYKEDTASSYSNSEETQTPTYDDDNISKTSTYSEDTPQTYEDTSSYGEDTTSYYTEYTNDTPANYSTYEDENYTPSRPTDSDYAPAVENIKIPAYDDYYDVPTRGGDSYKER